MGGRESTRACDGLSCARIAQDELRRLRLFGGATLPLSSGQIDVERPALASRQHVVVLLVDALRNDSEDSSHGYAAEAQVPVHLR